MGMSLQSLLILFIGLACRVALNITTLGNYVKQNVQIATPLNAHYRLIECATLIDHEISPYAGDTCHHTPIVIWIYMKLRHVQIPFGFSIHMLIDLISTIVLVLSSLQYYKNMIKDQSDSRDQYASDSVKIMVQESDVTNSSTLVAALFFLHPYSLLTCAAATTTTLNNLLNAIALLSMLKGRSLLACFFVAASAYLSLYPVMLIIPIILHGVYKDKGSIFQVIVSRLVMFNTCLLFLLVISFKLNGSWNFVDALYGFILEGPELTPNMGLFWYFFLEMFDHFRGFFLWVYQINAFIYLVPLMVVFRKKPVVLFYALLSLIALFKSYPSFGDLSIPIAMLPFWSHLYKYLRSVLLVLVMLIVTSILANGMWYLWIYAGSGNANFFYAVTLAYGAAQIFLLGDVLYAVLKYDFHLVHGLKPKTADGKDGFVIMK